MSQNPFEPPESKVNASRRSLKYPLVWKAYLIFSVYVAVATSLYVPALEQLSYFDVLDFGVSLVAVLGLYGFVYGVKIHKVVFWRYFFYVLLLESILFCLLLPLFGAERYGRSFQFNVFYLLELAYLAPMLYAVNMYAYKRPQLWRYPVA